MSGINAITSVRLMTLAYEASMSYDEYTQYAVLRGKRVHTQEEYERHCKLQDAAVLAWLNNE